MSEDQGRTDGAGHDVTSELRCSCGSLLAVWRPEGLEIKCRRCKRTLLVRIAPEDRPPEKNKNEA